MEKRKSGLLSFLFNVIKVRGTNTYMVAVAASFF